MTMPIETRIRWSGLLIVVGLAVLLVSLLWSHPLSFMAFLAVGCPLILIGILVYLWALAVKDGPSRTRVMLILTLLPLTVSGCGNGNDLAIREGDGKASALPAFDPTTATARVFGKVILQGKPIVPPLKIGRDEFCKKNAKRIFQHETQVNEDGTIRDVILYVRSGYEGRSYKVPEEPVVLDQQLCIYLPSALTLMKGQKLRILNSDPTFHNVHAQTEGGIDEFNIAQASQGAEDIQTFSRTAMPVRIGCDFHDWMVSFVGVFEHPFHTTSGERGKYELLLPPGKYELVAWHEKHGEQVSPLEVAANDSLEMNFTFSLSAKN